jgi:CHAT domain-containing protein
LTIYEKLYGKNNSLYTICLNNLSIYAAGLGNYNEAISFVTDVLGFRKKSLGREHPYYANSLENLARYNWHVGKCREAINLCTEALYIYRNIFGKSHAYYASSLSNLALYNASIGNYRESVLLCTEALNIRKSLFGQNHPDYINSLLNLAEYNWKIGNHKQAECCLVEYIPLQKEFILNNFIGLTGGERASLWLKYEFLYLTAFPASVLKKSSTNMISTTYSGLLFAKGLLLNADTELRKILAESGDKEVVNIYEELSTNKRILNKQYERPIKERTLSTDSLNTLINNLERQLVSLSKQYGDYTKNLSIDWKDVQKKLSANDIAVEFASVQVGDTTAYCAYLLKNTYDTPKMKVVLKSTSPLNKSNVYSTPTLSKAIWGSLADELAGVKNIYFGPSGELYNIAIESLPDWEDPNKLVSDRWNFYRLSSTRELALIKDKYSIKTSAVYGGLKFDADTATVARESRKYDVKRDISLYTPFTADSLGLRAGAEELPATRAEAIDIDKQLRAIRITDSLYIDSLGTETCFKALSGQKKNLLHIATHGFYWTEKETKNAKDYAFLTLLNAEGRTGKKYEEDKALTRSGLLFAGANNALKGKPLPEGVDDGVLTAQEISQLDLRGLDLVVLSACQTGLGEITGDGVFGLQRGFKKAGAQSILMSLWKVDDNATKMLMTQFYTNLTKGMSKRNSLLAAQRYVREYEKEVSVKNSTGSMDVVAKAQGKKVNNIATKTRKEHPYADSQYWAAFVLLDAVE